MDTLRENIVVPRGTIKIIENVNGDLILNRATVKAVESPITVNGTVRCDGNCIINDSIVASALRSEDGNIRVNGDLTIENTTKIHDGDLEVYGNVFSKYLDIDRKAFIQNNLVANEIQVGSSLIIGGTNKVEIMRVGGSCTLESSSEIQNIMIGGSLKINDTYKGKTINIGGTLKSYSSLEVEDIDVAGRMHVNSKLIARQICVGGSLKFRGGRVENKTIVGGSICSRDYLYFEDLQAGGSIEIEGGEGRNINVGSSLKCYGDLKFNEIDVGGTVKIRGDAEGSEIDVGGTVKVRGNLTLDNNIYVGGTIEVSNTLSAMSVESGGIIKADKIIAREEIQTHILKTKNGAKASQIELGRKGRSSGPLIARKILIRDKSEVEDLYGEEVILRKGCKANNIYATQVIIDSECTIYGKVLYKEHLDASKRIDFHSSPEKTEILPEHPL